MQKFSQEWKIQRGFRIIRMNERTLNIERQLYSMSAYRWIVIGFYKSGRMMEAAFNEMLRDDYTITEDCKETYFN